MYPSGYTSDKSDVVLLDRAGDVGGEFWVNNDSKFGSGCTWMVDCHGAGV